MRKRKSTVKVKRTRRPIPRRELLSILAVGVGAMAVSGIARSGDENGDSEEEIIHIPGSQLPQWVSWDDGFAHPIHDIADDGSWIVNFGDEGFFFVDPSGYVCDMGVWYPVVGQAADGRFWYSGDDDYEYQLETELVIVDIKRDDML